MSPENKPLTRGLYQGLLHKLGSWDENLPISDRLSSIALRKMAEYAIPRALAKQARRSLKPVELSKLGSLHL